MSIVSSICVSYRVELGLALHNFAAISGDAFKCALYTQAASLNKDTAVYTASGEVTGTGYTAGGEVLTNIQPTSDQSVAIYDFEDLTFATLTVTGIAGALIYNSTNGNRAVAVLDFVNAQSPVEQNFKVTFPSATPTTAILRNT